MHPDKIVIGAKTEKAKNLVRKVYTGRVRSYIPFVETNLETAEMIKYANNSFLATKISFINELANICDVNGADIKIISQAMGLDYRISPKFLNPGIGYGGSCFPKDVRALVNSASKKGYEAKLLKEVDLLNERQKHIFITKIIKIFGSDLTDKIFSIWGLSFKPKTSDIREATSLVLIEELIRLGAKINVYDPIAMDEVKKEIKEGICYCNSINETVKGSSGIIICTEWDEFRNINLSELDGMVKKIIFDGRNIYEPEFVKEEGFEYYGVGRK
jgi:UDPglucose 6-dehydrogenase